MSERKTRGDALLNGLTPEQQDAVFKHCEEVKLKDGVRWLLAEFDIEISENRLSVWLKNRREEDSFRRQFDDIRADRDRANAVIREVGSFTGMAESSLVMLGSALLTAMRSTDPKMQFFAAKQFAAVMDAYAKNKAADAKVIDSETSRQKFQFDAAKAALSVAAELQEINRSNGSEREKVERAIARLFGKRPDHIPGMPEEVQS